ncbi:MAG: BlaI/MecI/CopY family transcriptional regulator [Gemmatimonadetes bacterium]|nr:BlaI/MecI/CopY family transcriptional regulator [Gemmatimonadota bacterium]
MRSDQKSYQDLTDLQLALMEVLWTRGEATVSQVQEGLLETRGLAMTTVATLLSRLEKRGVVTHRTEGRQYVYRPSVSREEVCESMVSALTNRLFRGDVTALLSHLLTASEISPGDLAEVRRMIERKTEDRHGQ